MPDRDAEIERLRAQNHEHAARRDREVAELQSKVARHENMVREARRRMEHAKVDWTTDHPSQQPGGWWKYTSANQRAEVIALVEELDAAKAAVREWQDWVLGLAQIASTVRFARKVVERCVAAAVKPGGPDRDA